MTGGLDDRFHGLDVPDPGFADDDGGPDPRLAAMLEAYGQGRATERDVVGALDGTRVMVPLVAVLDEAEVSDAGLAVEKSSHMASVSLVSVDGRRGLLAFTSVGALAAWDAQARGVPVRVDRAATAAVQEGADALLLDLGGPVRFALQGSALHSIAAGGPWHRPYDDPAVADAVADVLADVVGLDAFSVEPGPGYTDEPGPDILVMITPDPELDVTLVADEVATRLAGNGLLGERCAGGIGIGVVESGEDED